MKIMRKDLVKFVKKVAKKFKYKKKVKEDGETTKN